MNRREYLYDNTGLNTYLKLQYDLTDWLQAKLTYSYGRGFNKNKIKLYAGSYLYKNNLNGQKTGTYYYDEEDSRSQILDFMLSGKNSLIDDLNISYNVGSQYNHNEGNSSSISGQLMYPELFYNGNISSPAVGEGFSQKKLMGLFATATLNFRDLLYVDLTGRNDWSSTLPIESRSYFYPSIGVTGIITEMLNLPSWVNFGKIRMSYSMVGNDPDPYNTAQTFTVSTGGMNGYMRPGGTLITPLKPEITKAYEFGLDWRFFESRLGMDVTLYKSNTVNQLISVAHPRASGYGSRFVNVGDVENKGLEFVLKGDIISNSSMTWESTINLAVNKNKILEIDPKSPKQTLTSPWNYSVVAWEDGSIGDMYTRSFLRDSTKQILIDDKGFPLVEKSNGTYIGNYNPKMTLGWNNRFDYKNFFTSFLIDGRFGGIVASPGDAILAADGSIKVTLPYREGSWVWPGIRNSDKAINTIAIKSEDFWSRFGGRYPQNGELFVYDATNFRLRELIVGYNFNFSSVIESARVSLTARNLFFIYRGSSTFNVPGIGKRKMNFDPDLTSNTGNGQGIVLNLLPSSRSFGVNINLTF